MARVIFSALIAGARNKIGDVVFSIWKGIPYVRQRVIPANPQSTLQTAQRLTFKQCVKVWQDMIAVPAQGIILQWNRFAEGYALSGFNRFVSIGSQEEAAGNLATITPANALVPKILTLAGATGASGVITVTWDATGLPAAYRVNFWYRLPEEQGIYYHGEALASAETYNLDGVTADTEFCVYAYNNDFDAAAVKDCLGESDVAVATSGA